MTSCFFGGHRSFFDGKLEIIEFAYRKDFLDFCCSSNTLKVIDM